MGTKSGNDVGGRSGRGEKWREVEGGWEEEMEVGKGRESKWDLNSK